MSATHWYNTVYLGRLDVLRAKSGYEVGSTDILAYEENVKLLLIDCDVGTAKANIRTKVITALFLKICIPLLSSLFFFHIDITLLCQYARLILILFVFKTSATLGVLKETHCDL